jgi:transmembrane sensor
MKTDPEKAADLVSPVRLGGLVLAGACVATVAFVFTHLFALNAAGERVGSRICAGIGETRNIPLDDGSKIELNTRSCVEVLVSARKREVRLLQGEALFTVRHDDTKPFTVFIANVAIDDLGTQFRVYLHEDQTDVGVLQGEVGIRARPTPRSANRPPVRLVSGEVATVISTPNTIAIRPEKVADGVLERALAWRQGALEFHNDSLKHAVAELNRYNVRQLVIVDPSIENVSVGGRFRYSDFDGFVQGLTHAFGIRVSVDESNPNILKLSGAQREFGEGRKRHRPVRRRTPQ